MQRWSQRATRALVSEAQNHGKLTDEDVGELEQLVEDGLEGVALQMLLPMLGA